MNVLLTGASGFIGSHLARALRAAGHVVIEARRETAAGVAAVRADFTRDLSARDWMPKLSGVDAVINAVGIQRERGEQTFERVHKRAPQALFTACVAAGVRRIVQISTLGADRGVSRYFLSKRAADDYLATLPLDWTIVRPALVFGPGGAGTRLLTRLARLPVVPLPGSGEQCLQPLHIDDLTEAVVRLLEEAKLSHARIELVGPQSLSLREVLVELRSEMRLGPPRFIHVPKVLAHAAAHVAALNPRSALDTETLSMLEGGSSADPATTRLLLGRPPRPLTSFLH
ncbi:MAG TPA: NAD-dependent epimerase/dehydratase family protein [Steroidobacteraceae bacterium]|nr:NAD-dependent epimerase/dehydratase family protein [Steroidobacteraceae bacterium]